MATLKLIQFSGETPRLLPRLLPDTGAQRAENVRLDNGGLTPIRQGRLAHTITTIPVGSVKTIYKYGSEWLYWTTIVNAAPAPVAEDRLYYTGDGVPKMRSAGTVYPLAVPFPAGALTAVLAGAGSGNISARLYCYTYVTMFGEESEPCPISNSVNWQAGNTVTLSGFALPPAGRGILTQRIYRSQSSVSAGTDLFLIAERNVTASNYSDAIAVDAFAEVLPSREWNAPPSNLKGLISLPNGMMAAFVGKDLYFCEPYRPHAWPETYVLTMDYNIVALGAYGTTIVVATEGVPYIVNGQAPENMVQEKLELNLPCINARGMVDLGYAVAYPSKDGLVVVTNGSASVATGALLTRDDWLQTSPATFVAGQFDGRYFASYEYIDQNNVPTRGTFIIDLTGSTPFLLRASRYSEACFYNVTESALYMLTDAGIYEWDALGRPEEIMVWKSKQFVLPEPVNFGCILVEGTSTLSAEQEAALAAQRAQVALENLALFALPSIGGEIDGSAFNTYPINGDALGRVVSPSFIFVKVIADGVTIAVVDKLNTIIRLPSGYKARNWEVEVSGTMEIAQISMATTIKELNLI